MTWQCVECDNTLMTHVVPVNDLREHQITRYCWCSPFRDCTYSVYIHNSMDKREEYEQGRKSS